MSERGGDFEPPRLAHLPRAIWMLGLTSLFMDMSTEILQSLLPLFMVSVLGAPVAAVGLIDGLTEATASFTKILSGAFSDHLGKRKALALAGYGFSALAKPLVPLASGLAAVFVARFLDRLGKGVRDAPRDALVADLVPPRLRGTAYGLRQGLDTLGALVGPLIAVALMAQFAGDFRAVFWFSCIPAVACVLTLALGVKEPERPHPVKRQPFPLLPGQLRHLSADFWALIGIIFLLLLPRFSESMLLLRAQNVGLVVTWVPMVFVAMNIVYAPIAVAAGLMSDRFGRLRMIFAGFAMLALSQLLLYVADRPWVVFTGAIFWGLHYGLTQGALSAIVADAAPKHLRGTAFGVFHLVSGIAILIGSSAAGLIWDSQGPPMTFLVAAIFGGMGLLGLLVFRLHP